MLGLLDNKYHNIFDQMPQYTNCGNIVGITMGTYQNRLVSSQSYIQHLCCIVL